MRRLAFIVGSLLVSIFWSPTIIVAADGQAKIIPLDQIFAYDIPGTRDVRELEPKRDARNLSQREFILGSLVNRIVVSLANVPKEGMKAGSEFVVIGTGKEALKNAHEVLTDKERKGIEKILPKDSDLSLVFYSYSTGWQIQLSAVEQSPRRITIKYRIIAQRYGRSGHGRFALIPIGKLSEGTTNVKIEELPPMDDKNQPMKLPQPAQRFICDSFTFEVH
jgi:hypothetical protein